MKMRETSRAVDKKLLVNNNRKKFQSAWLDGDVFGSAEKENERFINSAEGKIIKLKESLKQLVTDTISTDMFKTSLDGLSGVTGILNGITKAADKMHVSLPVALAGLSSLFMTIKALGTSKPITNLGGSIFSAFQNNRKSVKFKDFERATKFTNQYTSAINKNTNASKNNAKSNQVVNRTINSQNGIVGKYTSTTNSLKKATAKEIKINEDRTKSYEKYNQKLKVVSKSRKDTISDGLGNIGKAFAGSSIVNFGKGIATTVGNSLVLTAAFAGVSLLAQAMENYANREENAYQARKKNIQASKQQINSYESQKVQLQALAEEYDNLSKKENKSKEDNNRLNELKQQIAKIKPDAVIGTDENGIPILKGQVTDLIAEIDRAINAKERLMSYDKHDNAKTAAKKLNSPSKDVNKTLEERMRESETGKLVKIEEDYTAEVEKNKKRQEKAIEKYNNSTGRARDKARNELMSAKAEEEKIYFKYDEMYRNQVDKIQGYSKEIGDGIFSNIKNKTLYSGLEGNDKSNFAGLESLFDFSEVTPDTLVDTEQAVNKLLTAVRSGKVDVGDLSKTLKDANEEFARTQDIEKYNQTIDKTAKSIAKATNTDANIWENLFGQVNPNGIKDMTSINTLLAKFGKTKLDLANGDKLAMQLQNQFDSIQNILDTTTITGDVKVDANILTDIKNTKEVPSQVKGMIDALLGTGASSTDVLKFTMDVLMELQTGDPDITKLQNDLDNKFGKGKFTITPEILLSNDSGQANAEQIISSLKQRYEELPEEVITVIKANPTTTLEEADSVKRIYDKFPKEVKTIIKEEGADEGGRKILDLTSKYAEVPSELKTKLEADGVGLEKAVEVSEIYKKVPAELKTYFIAEAGEALYNSVNLKDALEHIPDEKITEIYLKQNDGKLGVQDLITSLDKIPLDKDVRINIYKALSDGDIDALGKAIESLPPDKRVEIIAEIEKAKDDIETISSSEIANKIFTIEVKDLASDAIEWIQKKLKEINGDKDKKDPVKEAKKATKEALKDKQNPKGYAFSKDKEAEKLVDDILNTPPTKQIELKLKKNEELRNTLNSFKQLEGRNDVKLKLESSGIETEQVKIFADIVKNLPTNSTFTNKFITDNVDSLKNLKDYEAVQKWLMDNPTIAMDYSINLNGLDDFDKMKSIYDGLEDKKDKKVFAEVIIKNPEKAEAFQKLYDNVPEETKSKVVSFAVENADELERATKLYESTPDEQKNQVLNFMLNNEDKLYLIEQLYNDFPESKDIIANLIVNNPDALDEVENLNALDLDKDVKINIIKSLTNGDINSLIAEIEKLPPEKQVEVIAAIEGAIEGIDSVDKKTIKDKWAKLKANNSAALETIRQTENKKLSDKSFTITAHLRTVGTLGGIASQFANNILGGLKSDRKSVQSINSIETPQAIPANLSAQPRTSEPAPISDETPVTKPSLFSRTVSRATSPIKTLTEKFSRITKTPKIALDTKSIDAAVKYSIELLKELENAISKVTDRISLLDKKMKYSSGKDKLKYLEEQNALYKEELTLLDQKDKALNTQKNRLKDRLKKDYKYTFSDDDNLTSYEEKLISLEKELEKLDKQSESDKGSKKSEERKKKIEEEKKVVEEYLKIAFTEIPKVADAQQEVTNSLIESTRAAEEFKKELKEIAREADLTSAQKHVTEIQNEIDLIDILMKNAEGDEKLDLIEKKKELLAKQAKEIKDVIKVYEDTAKELREGLSKEGFEFSADGKDIKNYGQQLEFLKNNKDADKYKEIEENAKKYLDLLLKDLPDANNQIKQNKEEIENLNKEIQDAYKEQLKEAQSLQEKIRDMYKKELEERLKEIDKETKAKIDSLKKQQDAYNDSRKEAKYKDDYEEQQDVISDLEKQIAIAERDSSLSGQKKLKDLQKQLKEEQKKLQDLVQDHVDDQVNDMYDKESDRLQEEADKLKEELEKKYSDENLVDLINEAISSGKFVGLDGEVKKLQDAIIEYINKYEDGMLAMGSVTKQEWLDKLKEGKETLEDINDILDELDLSKFAMPNYNPSSNSRSRSVSSTSSVNFNSPFFVVQGNVTKDTMKDLEKFGRDLENRVYRKIVENIKS
ncbi:TPA: hypothetical protein KOY62_002961 [Clostridioides difficile]|uniref:hypothetical protein n=1 Tax=Clostridioides difficile TaxID=1496 RepID=UPI001C1C129F|nr:hypothetical protein [Clostridioides difficile]MDC9200868.1 hypothetical protein [Clostridioides difficile]HBF8011309.1 hypothetical protein [Clostridioides difficile]